MRAVFFLLATATLMATPLAQARGNACPFQPDLGRVLAGPGAVDCGVAQMMDRGDRRRLARCAEKAIRMQRPVRFGVGSGTMGIDVFDCEVVVVDRERNNWLIAYSYDLSFGESARQIVSVSRCPTIDPSWKDPEGRGRFGRRDCTIDENALKRLRLARP